MMHVCLPDGGEGFSPPSYDPVVYPSVPDDETSGDELTEDDTEDDGSD